MKRINYKSDFDFFLRLTSANGEEIGWPPFDWTAKFRTAAAWQTFEASCIRGVCTNCYNDNGRIHVVADNHKLPPGRLRLDFSAMIPEGVFPDGSRLVVTPAPLDIELVPGASDLPTSAEADLLLPALKGEKGDKGADAVVCGHIEVETDRGIYRIPVASQEVTFTGTDAPGTCYGYYGDDNFCIGEWDI